MSESSQALHLCSSHQGMLKTVVSFFKNLRLAVPHSFGGPSTGGRPIAEGYDVIWVFFSSFPYGFVAIAYLLLVGNPIIFLIVIFPGCGYIIHLVALYSVIYWHREMPFRLIGAQAKFMIEVIPMITAAALHHLLDFNYGYIALLLACTSYFYAYAHFLHVAYDIGGIDVFMGLAMQVLAYMLDVELLVRALALSLCFGLCFYRYMTYCAPEVPAHCKKEVELPC